MIRSLPRTLESLAWDAQSNAPDTCPSCGEQFEGTSQCANCGYGEPDRDDATEAEANNDAH